MNYLIIGGTSLFGPFLLNEICKKENNIVVTKLPYEKLTLSNECMCNVQIKDLDLLNRESITEILLLSNPDVIVNFAVQNSVGYAWGHPDITIDVNINGLLNLLDTVRVLKIKPRIVVAGSGEEYGDLPFSAMPIKENVKQNPRNIFAASKVCQTMMCELYCKAYGMDIVVLRTFNEIGPGQSDRFVVSSLCHQFAKIEVGYQKKVIEVGNVNIKRDFTDVRDLVKAFILVGSCKLSSTKYNAGRGRTMSIAEVIHVLKEITGIDVAIVSKKDRLRLIDSAVFEADYSLLKKETGWKPEITIEKSINDMLNYWRNIENLSCKK